MPVRPLGPGLHLLPLGSDGPAWAQVFAAHATAVQVCLLSDDGAVTSTHPLTPTEAGLWSGPVPATHGSRYNLRIDGPWDPAAGHRHNPHKLVLDPYARLVNDQIPWGQASFGHRVDDSWHPKYNDAGHLIADSTPNVGQTPVGIAVRTPVADQSLRPRTARADTVVYEAHLRGLTMRHHAIPAPLRGTWAGLAHPVMIEHLRSLGVTAVELLPVFSIGDEAHLVSRGRTNYWGYSTLNFFSPSLRYITEAARQAGPAAILAEVHDAVEALHRAGLEVWLDVVYNHTCEGGHDGPTFSFRGVDAASYYRLGPDGRDFDVTGCGNTLDFSHPRVVALALDSLRHWATTFGIDGYRFDLAPALARLGADRGHAYDPDHPFLVAARADPVLQDVKLVAEPWDLGPDGWCTGQFPPPFSEWNDHFRDSVRRFWLTDAAAEHVGLPTGDLRDLATRLAGSADIFGTSRSHDAVPRSNHASINLVTAHDGFTLADLVRYNERHNQANGENNRDGSTHNLSWNHGVEGETDDPALVAARANSVRALLGTLLVSAGIPMLLAGDELGRTQHGNNNPYCLDDEPVWIDWDSADLDLLAHVRALLALRAAHPVLRQSARLTGTPRSDDGTADLLWFNAAGTLMDHDAWHDSRVRTVQMLFDGSALGVNSLLIVVNGSSTEVNLTLPPLHHAYRMLWNSAQARPDPDLYPNAAAGSTHPLPSRCVQVFQVH